MSTNLNKSLFSPRTMIKLSYTKKKYSDSEFLRLLDRRVKHNAKGINPNEEVVIQASNRDFKLAKAFLERIFKQPKIVLGDSNIVALSFDEEATLAIKQIQKAQRPKKLNNLLARITEEEIEHLCRIFKINNKKPEIHPFLNKMLEKHSDVAFGFAQALEAIKDDS